MQQHTVLITTGNQHVSGQVNSEVLSPDLRRKSDPYTKDENSCPILKKAREAFQLNATRATVEKIYLPPGGLGSRQAVMAA